MKNPRVYVDTALEPGQEVTLTGSPANHLRVLRLRNGDPLVLFNGTGGEYPARVRQLERREVVVEVESFLDREVESPLSVTLLQGVSKGERMDFTIQKAVELGVTRILPVFTERSVVQLKGERLEKKHSHWQGVIIAACEQSGRNRIPELLPPFR
nr:16S rRNA (uracil(1498)-N(3))-methyltransferase [Alkalilimnicola ehrlichii]